MLFMQVKATEGDLGSLGTIEYMIVEGDPNGRFAIGTSTGTITTTTALDREEQEIYVLRIQAEDQGLPPQSGFTQVHYHFTKTSQIFHGCH